MNNCPDGVPGCNIKHATFEGPEEIDRNKVAHSTIVQDITEVMFNLRGAPMDSKTWDSMTRVKLAIGASWGDSKEEFAAKLAKAILEEVKA